MHLRWRRRILVRACSDASSRSRSLILTRPTGSMVQWRTCRTVVVVICCTTRTGGNGVEVGPGPRVVICAGDDTNGGLDAWSSSIASAAQDTTTSVGITGDRQACVTWRAVLDVVCRHASCVIAVMRVIFADAFVFTMAAACVIAGVVGRCLWWLLLVWRRAVEHVALGAVAIHVTVERGEIDRVHRESLSLERKSFQNVCVDCCRYQEAPVLSAAVVADG